MLARSIINILIQGASVTSRKSSGKKAKPTSSPAASPANRTATPGSGKVQRMKGIYGVSVSGPLAEYDPASHSLRTSQGCLLLTEGDSSTESCLTFTRSGMMRSGRLFQLRPSGLPTGGIESGLWHTPRSVMPVEKPGNFVKRNGDRGEHCTGSLAEQVQRETWPTPKGTASGPDFARADREGSGGDDLATRVAKFPTPTPFPTPAATDAKQGANGVSQIKRHTLPGEMHRQGIGGQLNPTWVEWLMGYPLGWTALKDSATPSSRNAPK